ncbi:MAG: hypothetical protein ACRDJE_11875 [Dehalococcoidia bacterium]
MTSEQTSVLVFKNEAGDYFLVPQATLEQGRVPAERTAELERLSAKGAEGGNGEDVQGFALRPQDARTLAGLHLLTSLALYGLGDSYGGAYFAGQASGVLQGAGR